MVMPGTRRKAIPQPERTKVWVRSGGRCAICGRYLLEGALTHQEVTLGEVAHIVGQQTTTGSPRGKHPLSPDKRDKAENLMLLCAGEHDEIDRAGSVDSLTVDRLREIKSDHEDWVFRMTGLDRSRGTAVLRMIGSVRGNPVELSRASASDAVLRSDDRFPDFPLSYEQYGFEIDLRHVAQEGTEGYWAAARAVIDETIEHKLKEGVRREAIQHLSVFGFARLPLLVYLGSRLDDTYGVALYQYHRATSSWAWPASPDPVQFGVETHPASKIGGGEAVLVLNVSGTIQPEELPADVSDHQRFVLTPIGETPSVDVIRCPQALESFTRRVRELLSELEVTDKQMPALHIFAALPLSAAVALGRARDPHVHPPFVIYDRADGCYRPVLEIS